MVRVRGKVRAGAKVTLALALARILSGLLMALTMLSIGLR